MNLQAIRALIASQIQGTEFDGKTYFAGGCVRDYLSTERLDRSIPKSAEKDVDITVELEHGGIKLAEFLLPLLNAKEFQAFPAFGTAKLRYQDIALEFVATRKETYRKNSRYPKTSFGNLQDDVLRRDFTINTLLMELMRGEILDLTGLGLSDLKNKVIRSVGDPMVKFREDPLRMLRALRFALRFNFSIEADTHAAMILDAHYLTRLSQTSVKDEFAKMLVYHPISSIQQMLVALGWDCLPNLNL
ncbi:MAG: CCA tRNA nucleotidyltransferase [Candidatus Cloacimonetes bacterium]|nr:CCA tRNA nucleotidyltransferase [Candidatus Cloacimonadota bacterium]MDD3235628.1 CCA tRNA nucleotidyltransferase [Candidatus Cloacimonadota bacterium]